MAAAAARTSATFSLPPRMPTMIEDSPPLHVLRTDSLIPVEEPEYDDTLTLNLNLNPNPNPNLNPNPNPNLPGGTAQTREYYTDSSRRRKSLDRSSSIRRTAAAVVAEMDELKANASANANARVTPAASADFVHNNNNPLRDSNLNSNSLRDDERGSSKKSSSRWSKAWSIWGLIHRRGSKEEEGGGNGNGMERSYSESWQEYRGGERNGGDVRGGGGGFNPKMMRSNSSVSWRNGQGMMGGGGGGFGSVSMRKSDVQGNGLGLGFGSGRKGREEFVGLERNRSARYSSPNNVENNGLLRLYLGSRRNGSGKGRSNQAHNIARSVLRLY